MLNYEVEVIAMIMSVALMKRTKFEFSNTLQTRGQKTANKQNKSE